MKDDTQIYSELIFYINNYQLLNSRVKNGIIIDNTTTERNLCMKKERSRKTRLRNLMITLLLLSIVLSTAISLVSIQLFTVRLKENGKKVALGSSTLASELINADKINYWLKNGIDDEYTVTLNNLMKIVSNTPNLTYLYIYQIREDGCYVVFDCDENSEFQDSIGDIIDFDESFLPYKGALLAGEKIEDISSNGSYGWLLSHYEPIYDSNGECVAYAGSDVSLSEIQDYINTFVNYIVAFTVIFLIVYTIICTVMFRVYRVADETAALMEQKKRDKRLLTEVIEAFAKIIDLKDSYTQGHSQRVAKYTAMLAVELGYDEDTVDTYYNIALMHDIGKIGIPDEVLNKPGKLTDDEYDTIKSHTSRGYEALKNISLMPELSTGAYSHHERPDGKGYPNGLHQGEIPRVAQIIAVADTFDAMYSNRPYRKRMNFEKAVGIIKDASGTQLTSDVVDAFLRLVEKGEFRAPDDNGSGSTEDISNIRKNFS